MSGDWNEDMSNAAMFNLIQTSICTSISLESVSSRVRFVESGGSREEATAKPINNTGPNSQPRPYKRRPPARNRILRPQLRVFNSENVGIYWQPDHGHGSRAISIVHKGCTCLTNIEPSSHGKCFERWQPGYD